MIKKLTVLSAAAMTIAFAAPAEAQWVGFTANNNNAEFWDNLSDDGTKCNIGFVVTGVAGSAGNPCTNQRPDPWLPFTNTSPAYDLYNQTQLFTMFGGSITIVQAVGSGGDIAGQDRAWGVWTSTTLGGAKTTYDVNAGPNPYIKDFTGLYWGMWVSTTDGVFRSSDVDAQFARFGRSTGCVGVVCGPIVIGIEDKDVRTSGDRDYQDMIAYATITGALDTPEPSTYALMAAGLAALGMAARRRRRVA